MVRFVFGVKKFGGEGLLCFKVFGGEGGIAGVNTVLNKHRSTLVLL